MCAYHGKAIQGLSIANIAIVADGSDPFDLFVGAAWWGSLLAAAVVAVVPGLVAGILGVRNARTPAKLTTVMAWSIVGAAVYIVGMGLLGVVLAIPCILVAVFSCQDKKAYALGSASV